MPLNDIDNYEKPKDSGFVGSGESNAQAQSKNFKTKSKWNLWDVLKYLQKFTHAHNYKT